MSSRSASQWSPEERQQARELMRLRNIGPATADDLLRLGVRSVAELARQDPEELYARLAELDGCPHDPCVLDVFRAVVDIARGGPDRDWWEYSGVRKGGRGTRDTPYRYSSGSIS